MRTPGRLVLLTYIDILAGPDEHGQHKTCVGWFPSVIRERPKYRENIYIQYFRELEEMKRYNAAEQKKGGKWTPSKDPMLAKRPSLDAMLTDAYWDDGSPREVCSLTVRIGSGAAMLSLNDQENSQSITTNGESFEDAMNRLEAYLAGGNPTWRPWKTTRRK
jgi:hypothetical protein